jgi:hypothetical protein
MRSDFTAFVSAILHTGSTNSVLIIKQLIVLLPS